MIWNEILSLHSNGVHISILNRWEQLIVKLNWLYKRGRNIRRALSNELCESGTAMLMRHSPTCATECLKYNPLAVLLVAAFPSLGLTNLPSRDSLLTSRLRSVLLHTLILDQFYTVNCTHHWIQSELANYRFNRTLPFWKNTLSYCISWILPLLNLSKAETVHIFLFIM